MAALHLLLVVACVVSLAGEALGGCATAKWGDSGTSTITLETVELSIPHDKNVPVKLPGDRLVYGCEVVGVNAELCPGNNLTFVEQFIVLAELSEAVNTTAKLNSVVHCIPLGAPTTGAV